MVNHLAPPPPPEQLHYDTIEKFIHDSIRSGADFLFDKKLFDIELQRLWETYHVPYSTLQSFVRNLHVIHVKKTAPSIKKNLSDIIYDILQGKATILDLSRKWNFPPYLLTRNLLDDIVDFACVGENRKKAFSDLLRYPHRIKDVSLIPIYHTRYPNACTMFLEGQATEAIDADPMYGLQSDRDRHLVGVEYECVLEHYLNSMNIPFESEAQLRDRGTSKTPDVLLQFPIGIEIKDDDNVESTKWKMICWIDSKALFGDVHTHRTSVLPQALSYVHRFGPGLVIYWMGHALLDLPDKADGDISIIGWQLPPKIMLPNGRLVSTTLIQNTEGLKPKQTETRSMHFSLRPLSIYSFPRGSCCS